MRAGAAASCVIGACLLAGCGPRPGAWDAATVPRASVDAAGDRDWLDGGAEVTRAHVTRLFDLAARDPAANDVVDRAAAALAGGSRDRLAGLFRRCAPEVDASGEAGKTYLRWQSALVSKDHASLLAGAPSAELSAKVRELAAGSALRVEVEDHPDYVVVRRAETPAICLVAPLPVAAAYEAMIHELVHASARRSTDLGPDPASFADERAYLMAVVLSPGDEVDAYVTASGARARLDGTTKHLIPALISSFDTTGRLTKPRDAVAEIILAPRPRGLGYADAGLRGSYARDKDDLARLRASRREFLGKLARAKQQELSALDANVGVARHNLAARRTNLGIARQRGDAAEITKLTRQISADERALVELERTVAVVREGVVRLTAEQARAR
ncbi:MAG: hypothetical protein IT374_06955 [Polyangiaceae bacterium]|nr:hypothetical protein [Polyangiaceae bacterium]